MNRRAAILSAIIGGTVGLTAFGAAALSFNDGGSSAPTDTTSTTVEETSTVPTTIETTTTTTADAPTTTVAETPSTVLVVVPGPPAPSPPDTSGDLEARVGKVEKRVSTIESTIAAPPPPPPAPPTTVMPTPNRCGGRPINPATGYCT